MLSTCKLRASFSRCLGSHSNRGPQPPRRWVQGWEEGKGREANMLQPNNCRPIPAQGMGGLERPRPPSLHSSPLGSCCVLPNLLAGDKNTLAATPLPAPSRSCSARAGDTIEPSCPQHFHPNSVEGGGCPPERMRPSASTRDALLPLFPGHRSSAVKENGAAHRSPSPRRHHHVQSLAHHVPHPPANSNRRRRARAGSCSWG